MIDFVVAATTAMEAAIDRSAAAADRAGVPLGIRIRGMRHRGTAGVVVEQLRQFGELHPTMPPAELVELLAEWCEAEIERRPRYYTRRHMAVMIEYAGRCADVIEWNSR